MAPPVCYARRGHRPCVAWIVAIKNCGDPPMPLSTVRKNDGDPQRRCRRQSRTMGIPEGVVDGNQGLWGSPKAFSTAIESPGDSPITGWTVLSVCSRAEEPLSTAIKDCGDSPKPFRRSKRTMGIPQGVIDGNQGLWGFPEAFSTAIESTVDPHERRGTSHPFVFRPQAVPDDHRRRLASPKP